MKLSKRVKAVIAMIGDVPILSMISRLTRCEQREFERWTFQRMYAERFTSKA